MPKTMVEMRRHATGAEQGFTLLELLVSLMIFAVLAVIAYGGLKSVLDAQKQTDEQAAKLAMLQKAFIIINRDTEQMINRGIRDNYGDPKSALIGDSGAMEFSKAGWRNPAGFKRSNIQRIAYGIEDDQLLRLSWAVLDRAQDSEPMSSLIMDRVKSLEVRYLDLDLKWQNQWPVNSNTTKNVPETLPRALEVTMDVEDWGKITRLFRVAGLAAPVKKNTGSGSSNTGSGP